MSASDAKSSKPIVLVTGATGEQGGSVIDYLLRDGGFRVRGLTRKTSGDKAKALAARGVDVVAGDLNDVKTLTAAVFKDVSTVFLLTQFWETMNEEKEIAQGVNLINAVKEHADSAHVIFSNLPGAHFFSGGAIHVPHLDSKWKIGLHMEKSGLHYTHLLTTFYYQNLTRSLTTPEADGSHKFVQPLGGHRFGTIDVHELGGVVLPIVKGRDKFFGKTVDWYADLVTVDSIAKTFTKVTGKKATSYEPTVEQYAKFGFPGAEEISWMYNFFQWIDTARVKNPKNPYAKSIADDNYILGSTLFPGASTLEQYITKTYAPKQTAAVGTK